MLAPATFQNTQPTERLKPGDLRQAVSLRVSVRFRDAVKLRIPTRESSKASASKIVPWSLFDPVSRTGVMMAMATWTLSGDGIGHLVGLTSGSTLVRFSNITCPWLLLVMDLGQHSKWN